MRKLSQAEVNQMLIRHYVWMDYTGGNMDKGERANFSECNVNGLDFSHTDLKYVSFKYADCIGANFSYTSLNRTTFDHANLEDASFKEASLYRVTGDDDYIKNINVPIYDLAYTKDRLQIGCQNHSIVEWTIFSDSEIAIMDINRDAVKWWNEYKVIILETISRYPAKKGNI